ncbi:MAG: YfiR family protein [Planctomycetes bacterium]|nr:YfiR family protein [Planctomycetota bacterium]
MRGRTEVRQKRGAAVLWTWPLLVALATAQEVETPPKPPPAERCTPADARAGTVLKLAGYLTPEKPPQRDDHRAPVFRIGVLGKDDVTAAAQRLLPGKQVGEATATVVAIETLTAIEGRAAEHCDLLYVAQSIDPKVLARVVARHADKPLPIVCERPGFAATGGSIQLFAEAADVRFEVNADALQRQGIKPSPHLLKLSRKGPVP